MKTKIFTIVLVILLVAGIIGCFLLYNNNVGKKNDLAGISQDIKAAEDTVSEQKDKLALIEADIAEAEKKQSELEEESQKAEAQATDIKPEGNGYNLVELDSITAKVGKDNAEVYSGPSDEYETVEELTKGTEIIVDAKAIYQTSSFYRIKDSGKYINADALEIGEQGNEE